MFPNFLFSPQSLAMAVSTQHIQQYILCLYWVEYAKQRWEVVVPVSEIVAFANSKKATLEPRRDSRFGDPRQPIIDQLRLWLINHDYFPGLGLDDLDPTYTNYRRWADAHDHNMIDVRREAEERSWENNFARSKVFHTPLHLSPIDVVAADVTGMGKRKD